MSNKDKKGGNRPVDGQPEPAPIPQQTEPVLDTSDYAGFSAQFLHEVQTEAERLAGENISEIEWQIWAEEYAKKKSIDPKIFVRTVKNLRTKREKQEATAVDDARRERDKRVKERQAEKEKTFSKLRVLPSDQQDKVLSDLADRIEDDVLTLREEFERTLPPPLPEDDAWPEPVEASELLADIIKQFRRYVVMTEEQYLACALWTMFAWVHDIARHSPLFVFTSPEIDSGKSVGLNVMSFMVPRPLMAIEANEANVFRQADAYKPTLFFEEADTILKRKTGLQHIVLGGWTRGKSAKVPRQIGPITYWFDVFCPKAIAMKFTDEGLALPESAWSRSIIIKLKSKLDDEGSGDEFSYEDNEEFETIRRKATRWANDNMDVLKTSEPEMPTTGAFRHRNRMYQNWKLLLAIGASANKAKEARLAAIKITSRRVAPPSLRKQVLAVIDRTITERKLKSSDFIFSDEIVQALQDDSERDFGNITKKKVALLLSHYDIYPRKAHRIVEKKDKDGSIKMVRETVQGYLVSDFADPIARYLTSAQSYDVEEAPDVDEPEPVRPVRPKQPSRRRAGSPTRRTKRTKPTKRKRR